MKTHISGGSFANGTSARSELIKWAKQKQKSEDEMSQHVVNDVGKVTRMRGIGSSRSVRSQGSQLGEESSKKTLGHESFKKSDASESRCSSPPVESIRCSSPPVESIAGVTRMQGMKATKKENRAMEVVSLPSKDSRQEESPIGAHRNVSRNAKEDSRDLLSASSGKKKKHFAPVKDVEVRRNSTATLKNKQNVHPKNVVCRSKEYGWDDSDSDDGCQQRSNVERQARKKKPKKQYRLKEVVSQRSFAGSSRNYDRGYRPRSIYRRRDCLDSSLKFTKESVEAIYESTYDCCSNFIEYFGIITGKRRKRVSFRESSSYYSYDSDDYDSLDSYYY